MDWCFINGRACRSCFLVHFHSSMFCRCCKLIISLLQMSMLYFNAKYHTYAWKSAIWLTSNPRSVWKEGKDNGIGKFIWKSEQREGGNRSAFKYVTFVNVHGGPFYLFTLCTRSLFMLYRDRNPPIASATSTA
jgi:hypothetical protein